MNAPGLLWLARACWLALPFTLLEHVLAATEGDSSAVRVTAQVLFWVTWAVAFVASLVPLPSTLTAVRVLVPLAPAASLVAAVVDAPGAAGWTGLAAGTVAAVLVMAAPVGDWFVDGTSYGDERRFALKPPAVLVLGPLQLAWALTVVPLLSGLLLFAAEVWWAGIPLVLLGIVTAWWGSFALWRLARRWAVLVPAGLTLVDDMALAEPILLPAAGLARLGPAHVGSTALDLTVRAPGLVLEVDLNAPVELVPAAARGTAAESTGVDRLLFVPSRPATLLADAEQRGMAVDRG